ncbi:MAG: DUF790 family protein [Candidatus Ranarchaeia archaeon]
MGFGINNIEIKRRYKGKFPILEPRFLTIKDKENIRKSILKIEELREKKKVGNINPYDFESIWKSYKLGNSILKLFFFHFYSKEIKKIRELLSKTKIKHLKELNIESYSDFRIFLYQFLEAEFNGFVTATNRKEVLTKFAQDLKLEINEIEKLISLDNEENKYIKMNTKPDLKKIIELYNFHVLDTILKQGYKITFQVKDKVTGTLVKNFCRTAKLKGIVYDVIKINPETISFTIYGPFEIFGKQTKYGDRISELSLNFLSFLCSSSNDWKFDAEVIIFEKKFQFSLNKENLPDLALFEKYVGILKETNPNYDSKVESQFVKRFMANKQGWKLINEPEPLLVNGMIMIPDFAAIRDEEKIFIEVIGYWRPEYKKRKKKKLKILEEDKNRILLLIDQKFELDFPSKDSYHPIVFYSKKTSFNLTNLLRILNEMTKREELIENLKKNTKEVEKVLTENLLDQDFLSIDSLKTILNCYNENEIFEIIKLVLPKFNQFEYIQKIGLLKKITIDTYKKAIKEKVKSLEYPLKKLETMLKKMNPNLNPITFIEWTNEFEINWDDLAKPIIRKRRAKKI